MKMKCKIGNIDNSSNWEEELDVTSVETAKEDIKQIVKNFNDTLRPYEKPRKFISLIS